MGKSEAFLGELILNRQIPTYKNYYQLVEVMIWWMAGRW